MDTPLKASPAAKTAPKYVPALLALAVGFIAGYGAGRVSTGTPINPLTSQPEGGYEAGYEAARKRLEESGLIPAQPNETRSLTGVLVAVESGFITIEVDLRSPNPLDKTSLPKERRARLNEETTIYDRQEKSVEEFQKDMDAFSDATANREGLPPDPPPSFKLVPIKPTDLKLGQTVVVSANEDIYSSTAFDAVSVSVVPNRPALLGVQPVPTP